MKLVNTSEQMTPYMSSNTLLNVMLIPVLTALVLGANVEPAYAQNKLVIQADLARETIDKNIYGHFSEHLGRCIYGGYWVGEDSSIPNTREIRNDVVEALKRIKVPVLRWPGTIPANSTCDEIATIMDLLPTFAILGGGKVPKDRVTDGKNIAPLLLGRANAKSPHQAFLYYKGNNLQAVRSGKWKLHTNGELYNLEKDIGERQNVAKQNPDILTRLRKHLDEARADLDDPKNCRPVGKNMNPQYLVP